MFVFKCSLVVWLRDGSIDNVPPTHKYEDLNGFPKLKWKLDYVAYVPAVTTLLRRGRS